MKKKIVSLFDGYSGLQKALSNLNIEFDYYSSEIDKHALFVTARNFPETKQLGDIRLVDGTKLKDTFLLCGGSPCQDLSACGYKAGLNGSRSGLLFDYLRILKDSNPKYFILENVVSMGAEQRDEITRMIGVEPIKFPSRLVSAQNRHRYYWTNIPGVELPYDRGTLLRDVLEVGSGLIPADELRMREKSKTVRAGGRLSYDRHEWDSVDKDHKRKLTVVECERLQTLPSGYTAGVSDAQRFKMLGNGFTIKVIEHILSFIPEFGIRSKRVRRETK